MATVDVTYTVEAFVQCEVITAIPTEKSSDAKLADITAGKNTVWNYFGTRGGFVPLTNGSVFNEQLIVYVIRVWKPGSTTYSAINSEGVKIAFDSGSTLRKWATDNAKVADITGVQTVHGGSVMWDLNVEPSLSLDPQGALRRSANFKGDAFYVFAKPKKGQTGSIGVPPVRIKLVANSDLNTSPNDYDVDVSKYVKKPLGVSFTQGKSNSTQPPKEITDLINAGGDGIHCPCDGLWYGIKTTLRTGDHPQSKTSSILNNLYSVSVIIVDEHGNSKGENKNYANINGIFVTTVTTTPDRKGAGYIAARKFIQDKAACNPNSLTSNADSKGGGDNKDPGKATPYATGEPTSNPPAHRMSRDVPYMRRQNSNLTLRTAPLLEAVTGYTNNLGYAYADKQSADTMSYPKDLKFYFTYNPTTLSYATTSNNAIDWTLGSADPSNVLGGNTTVTFTLYLNRIADMTELQNSTPGSPYTNNYPRTLQSLEVEGILARGTEYDLEFFYRIVNGSPEDASQGLLYTLKGKSSDFGYITGLPFWLRFHDNLRYKVSLNSLQVNHVLFTENMIPMLTTVEVTATRIPVFDTGTIDQALVDSFKNQTNTWRSSISKGVVPKAGG